MEKDVEIRRPFVGLFDDALVLYQMATDISERIANTNALLARHSILTSAMSLEAAANSCLDMLRPRGKTMDDLERMTVIGKYDAYLLGRGGGKVLDRGAREVQPISEMKALRDSIVHPKTITCVFDKFSSDCYSRKLDIYPHLQITIENNSWFADDAEQVIRKTIGFLRYYFVEQCEHTSEEVKKILCSESMEEDGKTIYEDISNKGKEVANNLNLDLGFLGLNKKK